MNTLASGTGLYLKHLQRYKYRLNAHNHLVSAPHPRETLTSPAPPLSKRCLYGFWLRIVSGLTLYLYPLVFPVATIVFRAMV